MLSTIRYTFKDMATDQGCSYCPNISLGAYGKAFAHERGIPVGFPNPDHRTLGPPRQGANPHFFASNPCGSWDNPRRGDSRSLAPLQERYRGTSLIRKRPLP